MMIMAKKLTQAIFNGAPSHFISAAVDGDGTAYLYTALKNDLFTATGIDDKDGAWVFTKPDYSWIVVGDYDATDWQNSAINRTSYEIQT